MTMTAEKTDKAALPDILLAEQALEMSRKGDLLIIDVRTPMEWMRSGVAEGALTITPQNPAFMQELNEAVEGDLSKPIALICATGQRTAMIQRFLREQGYRAVADISEGMMGNFSAPGWLNKNLPTVQYSL
jgi:rhodanese-related sulfurtransferase